MSIFSTHCVIMRKGKFWNGGRPEDEDSWTTEVTKIVRFYSQASAAAVIAGIMKESPGCAIVEDE